MKEIDINTLCAYCGYFTSDYEINNKYGCRHPEIEDKDDVTGVGRCLASACPLGTLSDDDDSSVSISDETAKELDLI